MDEKTRVDDKTRSDEKTRSKVAPDLDTPNHLPHHATQQVSAALNTVLADTFLLYVKTKNSIGMPAGNTFVITI